MRSWPLLTSAFLLALLIGCGDGGSTDTDGGDGEPVSITSPSANDAIAGTFEVKAKVNTEVISGPNAIKNELAVDGAVVITDDVPFPEGWDGTLTYSLNTDALGEGEHTLQVWVTNMSGNRFTSAEVKVFITNDLVYSTHIQPIFRNSCAVSGCHDQGTAQNGLSLWTYEDILAGSMHGSVVVPENADKSPVIFFADLTDDEDLIMPPPDEGDKLDDASISLIRKWIDDGCVNDAGEGPFAGVTERFFNTNQGADVISVVERETGLTMRIIPVGNSDDRLEVPHFVITDDESPTEFFYCSMIRTTDTYGELWKFDASDYSFLGKTEVGASPAHVILTSDGSTVFVSNWDPSNTSFPTVQVVDAATMQVETTIPTGVAPHGMRITHSAPYTLFIGNSRSDNITVVDVATRAVIATIPLMKEDGEGLLEPLQIAIDRNDEYGYVSCHSSHEVQVFDVATRTMLKRIDLKRPGVSDDTPGPFQVEVSPTGEVAVAANQLNSTVSIISTDSLEVITHIEHVDFAQCHGVDIAEDGSVAYVTNQNTFDDVPPHHPTESGGVPGNVAYIDLVDFSVIRTVEVEEDPTGISISPGLGN